MIMREGCRWAGREVLRIISHRSSAARSTIAFNHCVQPTFDKSLIIAFGLRSSPREQR
jgi:hypothetical protein